MKLDLLYEIDVPKPWGKRHPYGQREAEQKAYKEALEQIAFGVDRDNSRNDWKEAIEIVCGMWESEYFEYHSPRFDFPRRMVTPKPVQDPHPPAWMAATSQGSSAVAGQLGLGLLSFA